MKTLLELLRDSALSMVFHVAPRFANVLVFILIGRLAGPDEAGVFSLATTYLLIVTTVMRGLDDLLIRQVAREPDRAGSYLANFLLLRLVLAVTVYTALVAIVRGGFNYTTTTATPIIILALSVLPDSLGFVAQSVMLGQRRFGPPAAILGGANVFKLVVGAVVLVRGGSLIDIAWIWFVGSSLAMTGLIATALRQVGGFRRLDWLNFAPLRNYWRTALSFSAITVLTTLDSQTDTILLSVFRSEAEIGWYGAATTITFSLLMLAQAYRFSVYPLMTRYAQHAPDKLVILFHKSMHYTTMIAMPLVAGGIILAQPIVLFVYGTKFAPTAAILQSLIVSLLFVFWAEPCNRVMLVYDRQRVMLIFLAISASTNVMLNIMLIPRLGAVGSGIARSCSAMIYFSLNYLYIVRRLMRADRLSGVARIAFSTGVMAMVSLSIISYPILVNIGLSIGVYLVALWITRAIPVDDRRLLRQSITNRLK